MIKEQVEEVKQALRESAIHAGRNPEEITLIAVSKTYPVEAIKEAKAAGCIHFGENKVQELVDKIAYFEGEETIKWHLIGHLQRNKVKYIVGNVDLIHSVDSIRLLEEIEKQSAKKGVTTAVLLEVNVGEEDSKFGLQLHEVEEVVRYIDTLSHVKMRGLMTVAPYVENPEDNRGIFRKLYNLSVDIQKQNIDNISTDVLSMGMSNDYQVAIEEGATMIRVGTSIFGQRDYSNK